jgi:hypothetical protein
VRSTAPPNCAAPAAAPSSIDTYEVMQCVVHFWCTDIHQTWASTLVKTGTMTGVVRVHTSQLVCVLVGIQFIYSRSYRVVGSGMLCGKDTSRGGAINDPSQVSAVCGN